VIDPLLSGAIIFSSLLTLLSVGLTLTYVTTNVSNFAHGAYAAIGAYVTFTTVRLYNGNPYFSLIIAVCMGCVIGIIQYLLIFRPLIRKGTTNVGLMVATIAIELVLLSILNIYADYITESYKIKSRYFLLTGYDIQIADERGILFISLIAMILTASLLYLVLTRTKFGIAMRAAIEDPSLASVVGINVDRVYLVSWAVSGSLGCLSGALLPLWTPGFPEMSAQLIVSVFAASIIGGLNNIFGAVIGGLILGLSEILGTNALASIFGSQVIPYRPLIPLIAIVITLLLAPRGILSLNWGKLRFITKKDSTREY
jgi:branched-chain amino acid transport system permease protein